MLYLYVRYALTSHLCLEVEGGIVINHIMICLRSSLLSLRCSRACSIVVGSACVFYVKLIVRMAKGDNSFYCGIHNINNCDKVNITKIKTNCSLL